MEKIVNKYNEDFFPYLDEDAVFLDKDLQDWIKEINTAKEQQ